MKIYLIASLSQNHVIGTEGHLPWHLPKDMAYFKKTTLGHILLMGRCTYESIPVRFRPLSERYNILLSRQTDYQPKDLTTEKGCVAHSFQEALAAAKQAATATPWAGKNLFVMGGGQVYTQAMPYIERLFLTHVAADLPGDTFFPSYNTTWTRETRSQYHAPDSQHAYRFWFAIYKKKTPPVTRPIPFS